MSGNLARTGFSASLQLLAKPGSPVRNSNARYNRGCNAPPCCIKYRPPPPDCETKRQEKWDHPCEKTALPCCDSSCGRSCSEEPYVISAKATVSPKFRIRSFSECRKLWKSKEYRNECCRQKGMEIKTFEKEFKPLMSIKDRQKKALIAYRPNEDQ